MENNRNLNRRKCELKNANETCIQVLHTMSFEFICTAVTQLFLRDAIFKRLPMLYLSLQFSIES